MKILQIITSLATGGAEKLLLDAIPMYRAAGIEMDLLLFWDNGQPFTSALKEYSDINVFVLSHSEKVSSVYNPSNIWKAKKFIKGYDLVHVHLFPPLYYIPLAKKFLGSNVPLLYTEHSTTNRRMKLPILKNIDRYFYRSFTKVICITEEVRTKLKSSYGFPDEQFALIENGVNIKRIQDAKTLSLDKLIANGENAKVIVQVSAFRSGKDQKTVIRAMTLLPDSFHLLLVGEGGHRIECENLTKELGLENRVHFLGHRMDVPDIIKTADINVLSSEFEGLSLASIEAMASGRPFIASRVPGLEDLVDGHGLLFELGNEKDLAHKIQGLMDDPNYYQEVAQRCEALAAKYDISTMVEKHIDLYKSVIAQS